MDLSNELTSNNVNWALRPSQPQPIIPNLTNKKPNITNKLVSHDQGPTSNGWPTYMIDDGTYEVSLTLSNAHNCEAL